MADQRGITGSAQTRGAVLDSGALHLRHARGWRALAGREGEDVDVGEGELLQTGYQVLGEARGFEQFDPDRVAATVKEAVRLALQALEARPAPAGTFPVILSSSAGGTCPGIGTRGVDRLSVPIAGMQLSRPRV